MANHQVLLNLSNNVFWKKWEERRNRQALIQFFDALSLYLRAGFALSYSWPETLQALGPVLPDLLRAELGSHSLEAETTESVGDVLNRLKLNCRFAPHRLWFGVLAELYSSGTSLVQPVQAIAGTLRKEQHAELENHLRVLPVKVNVVLMVFFLPPTFLWLFGPLLMEILAQFE
jgi:hypothetical protein